MLLEIKFQCMGTWEDDYGNVWSGVADLGQEIWRERFRCLVSVCFHICLKLCINVYVVKFHNVLTDYMCKN